MAVPIVEDFAAINRGLKALEAEKKASLSPVCNTDYHVYNNDYDKDDFPVLGEYFQLKKKLHPPTP
jgi:hypothetical protein